jgi:predicted dehydrogenase
MRSAWQQSFGHEGKVEHMTPPVRIGILGTGNIAARALIAPARDVPEVSVLSVASRDLAKAASYATANAIPDHTDYEGLLADPDIEVAYITLPNSMHADWSIRALEAGKHVLCEKPMAANEHEAREVAAVVERTRRVYLEAFHFPYHPFAKRVRDLLDTRVLGRIIRASAGFQIPGERIAAGNIRRDFALAGGALMDAGCYPLNALRHLLGEPESVLEATAQTESANPQIDLGLRATLVFAGGIVGTLHASFLAKERADVEIVIEGERGRLMIQSLYVPQWGGSLRLEWNGRVYEEPADQTPSYVFQLRELVRCVRDGAPVLTSAADGVLNMRVIDAIYDKAGLKRRGT